MPFDKILLVPGLSPEELPNDIIPLFEKEGLGEICLRKCIGA
jgi:hypothetical protein